MKPVKRVSFQGSEAVLFANGDVMWAGMFFEQGKAANAGLLTSWLVDITACGLSVRVAIYKRCYK